MPLARLATPIEPGGPSRGDLARDLAQRLADAAAQVEGRPAREMPRLADEYAGDQVAVTVRDLAVAGETVGVDADPADPLLAECITRVRELRLRL